jgi:MFS family permease
MVTNQPVGGDPALVVDPAAHRVVRPDSSATVISARRAALLIAALGYCGGLVSVMHTVALPLLPRLPGQLHATVGDVSWVATSTLLAGAVANPVLGRLGDMYGKRRMLLVSLAALAAGSAVCAVSNSLVDLVVGRTLQGLGVGVIPLGISIARDELPAEKVNSGIALVSATLGIGAGLGLPLAGVILQYFDWHAVFWLSTLLSVLGLVVAVVLLPESPIRTPGRFDVVGAVWLSAVLVLFLVPISKAPSWGWIGGLPTTLFSLSLVGGVVWFFYERRCGYPVVDVTVMRRRPVMLANIAGAMLGFAMFVNFFATITILQLPDTVPHGFGTKIVVAGLVLLPGALAMVAMSPVSARITNARGARTSLLIGCLVVGAAYLCRPMLLGSLVAVGLGVALVNCGVGIAYGALPAVVMANVPISETGSANAVNALARAGGASIGSAAVAAAIGSLTVTIGGQVFPSLAAFQLLFFLSAAGALAAAGLAYLLPRSTSGSPRPS